MTIHTIDSDVLMITVALIQSLRVEQLYVEFGTGKTCKVFLYTPSLQIMVLNVQVHCSLCMYSVAVIVTVSSFFNIRKKTVWETWHLMPCMTSIFNRLSSGVDGLTKELHNTIFAHLQRFVMVM